MLRRIVCPALAVLIAAAMAAVAVGGANGNEAPAGSHAGPPYNFTTELMGDGEAIPLKDTGMLTRTEHGYRFWSGQQASHLVVTRVDGGSAFIGSPRVARAAFGCGRSIRGKFGRAPTPLAGIDAGGPIEDDAKCT